MIPNDRSQITADMIKNRDFKTCACGRKLSPSEGNACQECERTKTYFQAMPGPSGPNANVPPVLGRPH